jgi:KDO2-lipid IV(A) lauroyltransferase
VIAIQNLLNYLAVGVLRLFAFLPYSWVVFTGDKIGLLIAHIPSERNRVVKTNLHLCFPKLSSIEINALAERHWRLFSRSILERSKIWLGSPKQIWEMVEIDSEIDLNDQKPRILVNPHFVGIEGGMALCALAEKNNWHRGVTLYQKMKNPFFNRKIIEWRSRFGGRSIPRQGHLSDTIREIKSGNFVFIAPDIDLGIKDSAFVPFFGVPTNTITAISRLARLSGAEVCIMKTTLKADQSKYICHIGKPLPNFPTQDAVADTAKLNTYFEDEIRLRPAEYYWVHKRFKNRPLGSAKIYS